MLGFLVREIIWYFADADASAAGTIPFDTMPDSPSKPFGGSLSDKRFLPHMNPCLLYTSLAAPLRGCPSMLTARSSQISLSHFFMNAFLAAPEMCIRDSLPCPHYRTAPAQLLRCPQNHRGSAGIPCTRTADSSSGGKGFPFLSRVSPPKTPGASCIPSFRPLRRIS